MLEALKLFPAYLTLLTFFLVILPTVVCASVRLSLYRHLQDLVKKTNRLISQDSLGKQPQFVNLLKTRFSHASKNIEHVNTLVLIDSVYSQEKFTSFRFNLRCQEGEYLTKTLPNLLLAFGLLGTFLGITFNLYNISQIINQGNGDIADLTSQLQTPLQSMGIAFITSLIALICSSFLTVINLKFNTIFLKNDLLNNLEDYLDNIYKPQVEGDTRLDKAVNKMVEKQTEFLTRFHENVGQVLERTFKQAAERIANENEKSQQLAYQVYQRLLDASSAINNGANTFQESMLNLDNQVQSLRTMIPVLTQNIEDFNKSADKIFTASTKIEASRFSENLEKLTADLAQTENNFTQATNSLAQSTLDVKNDNQQASKLAQQVYEQLKVSSQTLEASSVIFANSANAIKESQFSQNLVSATSNLSQIDKQFLAILNTLKTIIKPIAANIQTLDSSINKMVEVSPNYEQFKTSIERLDKSSLIFGESAINIKDSKFNDRLFETTSNLVLIQQQFGEMVKSLNQIVKPIEINVKTLELSTDKMMQLSQNVAQINSSMENINDCYNQMTSLNKDILLKQGEICIDNKHNLHELSNCIRNLNDNLQQRFKLLETTETQFLSQSDKLINQLSKIVQKINNN